MMGTVASAPTPKEVALVVTRYQVVLERDAAGTLRSANIGVSLIDQYLRYLAVIGRASTTISSYAYDLALFCRWLAAIEDVGDLEPVLCALRCLRTSSMPPDLATD
jgi:hypothetical protein